MHTERQIQETVARCVSIMVFFHNVERTKATTERMVAEIQVVAGWVMETGMKPDEVNDRVLRPVEAELVARYGHEVGPRLNSMFLNAFETLTTRHASTQNGSP